MICWQDQAEDFHRDKLNIPAQSLSSSFLAAVSTYLKRHREQPGTQVQHPKTSLLMVSLPLLTRGQILNPETSFSTFADEQ